MITGSEEGNTGGADTFADPSADHPINGQSITQDGDPVTVINSAVTGGLVSLGEGNVLTFTPAAALQRPGPHLYLYGRPTGGVTETADVDVTVTDAAVTDIVDDTITTKKTRRSASTRSPA